MRKCCICLVMRFYTYICKLKKKNLLLQLLLKKEVCNSDSEITIKPKPSYPH